MPKSSLPTCQLKTRQRLRFIRTIQKRHDDVVNTANERRNERNVDVGCDPMPGTSRESDGDSVAEEVDDRREMRNIREGAQNLIHENNQQLHPEPYVHSSVSETNTDSVSETDSGEDDFSYDSDNADANGYEENEKDNHDGQEQLLEDGIDDEDEMRWEGDGDNNEDDSEDENDYMFLNGLGHRPLYRGARLTAAESVASILSFMVNHNLGAQCVEDLIHMIQLHCPEDGLVKLSLYKLRKYFSFTSGPVKKHFYCEVCQQGLPSEVAVCQTCARRRRVSFFIQMPIIPQLRQLFKRPQFYFNLQNRFTRRPLNDGWIEDIYDGQVYKEQVLNGFLSNPNNFSMTYFVDKVPVLKSKNDSFWGFFLTINELPHRERVKRENTLLAGLWLGKKPHANLFMSSFLADFQRLYQGVNIHAKGINRQIRVRGLVIAGVADTPARSTFMNCMDAFFGCPFCEIEGATVKLPPKRPAERGPKTDSYRYQQQLPMRNVQRMTEQGEQAVNVDVCIRGVKGPTALRLFMPDFLRGTAVDIMRLIQGLMKKMFEIWFESKFLTCGFSVREVIGVVNQKLLALKPPEFIHRYPQKIQEWHFWKTSDFVVFFFITPWLFLRM